MSVEERDMGADPTLRGAAEDAHQSVEQLFEARPVDEIRGVEKRAKSQVEVKREELRQVVGASYREFIDSADGIKAMAESSVSAASDLEEIRNKIFELGNALERKLSTAKGQNGAGGGSEGSAAESALPLGTRLYALGSRAKVLLDTSESIWAVLEAEKNNQKTLEASTLSESVDSAGASSSQQARILSHGARLAARAFVLWQTQGQEVSRKFPLLAKQRVQLVDLCRKLRAACLCRLESGHLDRALTVDALAALALLDVVQSSQKDQFWQEDSIKSGLSLCSLWLKQRLGAISKSSTSWEKLSAVGEIVKDVVCEVESLFVASKHHAKVNLATLCLPDVEGDIWYKALPGNDKELELWQQYLEDFVHTTSQISLKMVSELCSKWIKSVQEESAALGRNHVGVLSLLPQLMEAEKKIQNTLNSEAAGSDTGALPLPSPSKDFESHSLAILRRKIHLWKEFYEVSFAERAKEIIQDSFVGMLPAVKAEIGRVDPSASADLEVEYRNKLCRVLNMMRVKVGQIFIETVEFFLLPSDTSVLENRTSMLQGFLQECCFNLLKDIGDHLEKVMGEMSSGNDEDNLCEYGIFLSNFCDCLQTQNSDLFDFIFGKPKDWINVSVRNKKDISAIEAYSLDIDELHLAKREVLDRFKEASLSSAQVALSTLDYPLKSEIDDKLQTISRGAFSAFVDYVCAGVQASVDAGLASEVSLLSSRSDTNWEEVVVEHRDEEGKAVEMKFLLPHMASPFVVDTLFAALGDLHKARYVKSNLLNLEVLEEELSQTFVKSFNRYLDARGHELSERGALQLLFDVRFVFDVLAGGSASSGPLGMLHAAKQRHSARLEQRLSALLDPIDWATYEPYLWKNEVQFYHRCSLLFHDFTSLERVHGDKEVKMKSSSRSNIMEMSSNVPRFNYLPISTPSVFKAETADELLAGTFAEPLKQGQGQSGGTKLGNGAMSDKEKSNIFGSILGEKAAEATAMAQDLFSGAGFFTSLTSNK